MWLLSPLRGERVHIPTSGSANSLPFTFISHCQVSNTLLLAYLLDSLVRVPRRVNDGPSSSFVHIASPPCMLPASSRGREMQNSRLPLPRQPSLPAAFATSRRPAENLLKSVSVPFRWASPLERENTANPHQNQHPGSRTEAEYFSSIQLEVHSPEGCNRGTRSRSPV